MLGSIIGAALGSRFDQSDGRGGIKGALMGAAVPGLLRRAGPLGLVLGAAYLAKKSYDNGGILNRGRNQGY